MAVRRAQRGIGNHAVRKIGDAGGFQPKIFEIGLATGRDQQSCAFNCAGGVARLDMCDGRVLTRFDARYGRVLNQSDSVVRERRAENVRRFFFDAAKNASGFDERDV